MRCPNFGLSAVLLVVLSLAGVNASHQTKPIQIGMAKSFVAERPKSQVDIATDEFKDVMKKTTGLDGELTSKFGAFDVADKLKNKQLDLGIFHAHELAWVQKKHPELQPLLIAAGKHRGERAYLIVHKTNSAKSIAELRGKKLDLSNDVAEHGRLYVEKLCAESAKLAPALFFGSITKSPSQSDALDAVARGNADATVVDTARLEFYKEIKGPVFAKNLRILQESETFPPAVIVSLKGGLDEATVKQFREGLLKAHTTAAGRDMMKTWNIEAFEPIPDDYANRLAELLKAYPVPPSPR